MKSNQRIVVSVTNDLVTDQRVHKVCLYLHEKGFKVTLVGRIKRNSLPLDPRPYQTKRIKLLVEKGPFFYAFFNIRLFFYLLFKRTDVFLANDLDTLLANYRAAQIRNRTLIYDTHEYFTEVPELIKRPKVKAIWERIEKKIFPKLKFVYTVNASIAELYRTKYGIPVGVVRNIPSPHQLRKVKSRNDLQLPNDKKIIIIQGAGINIDRGNEEMVEAMQWIHNSILLIIGDGDVVCQLKKKVNDLNLTESVLFKPKMPYADLMQYTFNADLGITLDKNTNINYKFSLPNKLFDFIHAEIPILCSDLPEISAIVNKYNVGIICETHDPKTIAQKINSLFVDSVSYNNYKSNTTLAKTELTWENECRELDKIYNQI